MKVYNLLKPLVLVGSLSLSSLAFAQATPVAQPAQNIPTAYTGRANKTPEQRLEKRLTYMQKKLGLSDQQVSQVRSILQQNQAKLKADRQAFKNAASDQKDNAKNQMRADMKAQRDQLFAVLTPDQQAKWKQFKGDHHGMRDNDQEQKK